MTNHSVALAGSSVEVVPSNPSRQMLVLQNQHAVSTYWVNFSGAATQDGRSLAVAPGMVLAFSGKDCPTEQVLANGPSGVYATVMEQ